MHIADNDQRNDGYEDSHLKIGTGEVPIEKILQENNLCSEEYLGQVERGEVTFYNTPQNSYQWLR